MSPAAATPSPPSLPGPGAGGESLEIHCIAIGGTGTAPLACLLQELGHRVRGSDGPLYPPMSTLLADAGIEPRVGFDPAHLEPPPDLVVVGNAVPRTNAEALRTEELGLPRLSMPEAISRFLLPGRRPLVVAGTHGKTTTTAMAAWVLTAAGRDPGYLVGGVPQNLPASFHLGTGERFVIEGDEYNAAYFDRGPKFLHYRPQTLILTSVEYDHADLYESPEALLAAYAKLVALLPDDGLLVAWGDDPQVRELAATAPCRTLLYGFSEDCDLRPSGGRDGAEATARGSRLRLPAALPQAGSEVPDMMEVEVGVPGLHNAWNALAVWAVALADGLPPQVAADALARFAGVQRRLEELGTVAGVTVVDDFAHHPTAVGESLKALARRYPGRRLVALFEPRSLTAGRELFHRAYFEAFSFAHRVLLAPVFHADRLEEADRLDRDRLVDELRATGVAAQALDDLDAVLETAASEALPGDVLVTMSSGAFGGLPRRLLEALGS